MEYIIITMFGIFIGIAVAGYMFVTEINKRDRKIFNQKAMIENRDILIDRQCNQLSKIKNAVNKKYYTLELLKDEIKSILSDNRKLTK